MKTQIFPIAIAILMAGTFISGCESAQQKEAAAKVQLQDAQQDLKEAQENVILATQNLANSEEWRMFKSDVNEKITKNENRIAELKIQLKKPGEALDEAYAKRIDALEQQNKDLRVRMVTFERNQSDWDSFKRKFNQDLDELWRALRDFTVND